jgi:hypothetical protein
MIRVKDIEYKPGCCCCGACGTIVIMSSDETSPTVNLSGIPNGQEVYGKIRDAMSKIQSGARVEIQA